MVANPPMLHTAIMHKELSLLSPRTRTGNLTPVVAFYGFEDVLQKFVFPEVQPHGYLAWLRHRGPQ